MKTVVPELTKFVTCRIGSGLLETGILFLCVDLWAWNGNVWKLITSVLVVILNYIASKLLVFKR
jgi:putative flippase GtrA